MLKGVLFALSACLIWGLIFVVPQFMQGYNSLEIAMGRYFFFGAISCLIFLRKRSRFSKDVWIKALYYSLVSTFGYYVFLVLGIQYASAAVATLIVGLGPIAIAFYGNWQSKEASYKSLILPSALILIALAIINVPYFEKSSSPLTFVFGLCAAFVSLISWTWYVVANSRFLKQHRAVKSGDWSTLIGICALFWTAIFSLILFVCFSDHFQLDKFFTHNTRNFFLGSAILGLLCSWVGAFLWNRACLHLPVSLAGQLTIFETIFGITFVFAIEKKMPPLLECIGILLMLCATYYGIRSLRIKNQSLASSSLIKRVSSRSGLFFQERPR